MKSPFSFLAFAALAASACILACAIRVVDNVTQSVRSVGAAAARLFGFVLDFMPLQHAAVREAVVLLVVAKAFVQRILRRERICIESQWRRCPSV